MNYELLFEKCQPLNIDLNWIIYGTLISQKLKEELITQPDFREENDYTETEREQKTIQIVEMINKLPWPIPVKRIIMENYLDLVYSEEIGKKQ